MSASKKKNLETEEAMEDNSDNESESESDVEEMEVYTGNEELQVDFEGRNPIDSDFHGICQLLQQLFLKAQINLTQMAEEIIGQNYIGSVVTQSEIDDEEDDDDELYDSNMIFGITSALNITTRKDITCIEQLRNYVIEKAEQHAEEAIVTQLRNILGNEGRPVGFLINERFINIPPQISVPLLENLYKEIKRANEKKMNYNFKYYLMLIKFYRDEKSKTPENIYSNSEEEVICDEATLSFEYSVQSEADSGMTDWSKKDSSLVPYRKVVLFEASKLAHIVLTIKEFINE